MALSLFSGTTSIEAIATSKGRKDYINEVRSVARHTNKTVGSGMTEHAIVEFDWSDPADLEAHIRAAIRTLEQTSFDHLSKQIVRHAVQILSQAGLPTETTHTYVIPEAKKWALFKRGNSSKISKHQGLSLLDLVLQLGCMPDSPEGYAARLISLIDDAHSLLQSGQLDEAMAKAFAVGELINEAWMKEVWEQDALRGVKILESARSGHEAIHGTEEAKTARRKAYLMTYNKSIANRLSRMAAYKTAAKQHGVSERTIQRAVAASSR